MSALDFSGRGTSRAATGAAFAISAGSKSGAGHRGSSVGGKVRAGVRGTVPGRGEETGNKKSPFAKGGQRGNVNTGSFRMSSGAVHAALAISAGSKSGAGHRNFRLAGSRVCVRGTVPGRGEKAGDKKSPFVKGGQRGNVNTGSFRMSSGAVHAALAISAGSKSGAGHRNFRLAGSRVCVRGTVPGRGEKAGDKKSPFVKGGQRGNVCTGFFRMRNGSGCNGCGLCYFCRK